MKKSITNLKILVEKVRQMPRFMRDKNVYALEFRPRHCLRGYVAALCYVLERVSSAPCCVLIIIIERATTIEKAFAIASMNVKVPRAIDGKFKSERKSRN